MLCQYPYILWTLTLQGQSDIHYYTVGIQNLDPKIRTIRQSEPFQRSIFKWFGFRTFGIRVSVQNGSDFEPWFRFQAMVWISSHKWFGFQAMVRISSHEWFGFQAMVRISSHGSNFKPCMVRILSHEWFGFKAMHGSDFKPRSKI